MLKSDYLYNLPPERIAFYPCTPRDSSKLLVVHKSSGKIEHRRFTDILGYLVPGDVLVLNDSRVRPVRFRLHRKTGGVVELLFTHRLSEGIWNAIARPSKRPKIGERLVDETQREIVEIEAKDQGRLTLRLLSDESELFSRYGLAPLPGYIHRVPDAHDLETYQTVYAHDGFSIAAPTAGLHFTPELLDRLESKGVKLAYIQLDVGEGTFRPLMASKVEEHRMLAEDYSVSEEAARKINSARRIIAVGTTVTRTLESFGEGPVVPGSGSTELFIYPGHRFGHVDLLLTNFHQPASTPLLLTAAFCGRELLLKAYGEALSMDYRFLSYGDAMIILPFDFDSRNQREPKMPQRKASFGDPVKNSEKNPGR